MTDPLLIKPTPPAQKAPQQDCGCGGAGAARSWIRCVRLFVITTLLVLVADLLIKNLAFRYVAGEPVAVSLPDIGEGEEVVPPHDPIVLVPHVLSLRLRTNTGAVFGLGKGKQWFFELVSVVAVGMIAAYVWRHRSGPWAQYLALGLICGGALGNLYDRVRFHAVRDMFWLFPSTGLWPWIFNLADAALMVGVFLLLFVTQFGSKPPPTCGTGPR
jgi:signal peptidase II